jgi:hypothetical protein
VVRVAEDDDRLVSSGEAAARVVGVTESVVVRSHADEQRRTVRLPSADERRRRRAGQGAAYAGGPDDLPREIRRRVDAVADAEQITSAPRAVQQLLRGAVL